MFRVQVSTDWLLVHKLTHDQIEELFDTLATDDMAAATLLREYVLLSRVFMLLEFTPYVMVNGTEVQLNAILHLPDDVMEQILPDEQEEDYDEPRAYRLHHLWATFCLGMISMYALDNILRTFLK